MSKRTGGKTLFAFLILACVDVALFNLAFFAGYGVLWLTGHPVVLGTYTTLALAAWLLPPAIFFFCGMYHTWDEYIFSRGINSILTGVTVSLAALLGLIWVLRDRLLAVDRLDPFVLQERLESKVWGFPASVLVMVLLLAPLLIWLWRNLANLLERRFLAWSARRRSVVVVGRMGRQDLLRLEQSRRPYYDLLGTFGEEALEGATHLGTSAELATALAEMKVDEAFLVAADFSRPELLLLLEACFRYQVRPRLVVGIYETLLAATQSHLEGEIPVYRFRRAGIAGWTYVAKMLIDAIAAILILLVTGPLLILPACIGILIDSKGWPVFSQIRVGLNGRRFKLFKLRTMVIDADVKGGPLTTDNDPRITRFGRFLRRTSIDELPQLWNVLRGDMSLVGPRAVIPFVADKFDEWERVSLSVKPGVTGLAQVSGRDDIGFREKSLLNLYYVRNHSIWLDLRIILDTIGVVLSMEGTGGTLGAAREAARGEGAA